MRKHRLKNYLKLGILLFGIAFLLYACEKDFLQEIQTENESHEHQPEIVTEKLSFNELPHKTQIKQHLQQISANTATTAIGYVSNSDGSSSGYIL